MTTEDILSILKKVKYPGYSRDIVSFGLIKDAKLTDGHAEIKIEIGGSDSTLPNTIRQGGRKGFGKRSFDSVQES